MTDPRRADDAAAGAAGRLAAARRERRAFIATQHPDRGGDPVAFVEGLRRLDNGVAAAHRPPAVVVRHTQHPARTVARFLVRVRRSLRAAMTS